MLSSVGVVSLPVVLCGVFFLLLMHRVADSALRFVAGVVVGCCLLALLFVVVCIVWCLLCATCCVKIVVCCLVVVVLVLVVVCAV